MKKSKKLSKTARPSTRETLLIPYYSSSRKKILLYELLLEEEKLLLYESFEQKLGWQFTARLPLLF